MIDTGVNKIYGFQETITRDQAKDTGMAMVLICLLTGLFFQMGILVKIAVVVLLADMIYPDLFKPLAVVWLGLSHLLGTVMSKIILSVVFFLLVTPVGLIRKISGADALKLKEWKQSSSSVFKIRDHVFTQEDITKPY